MKDIGKHLLVCALGVFLFVPAVFAAGEEAETMQKTSEELLLEIMDVHTQIVTNEVFLAQAKMVGSYLEAALQFEESKKVKAYSKVLGILSQIKNAPTPSAARTQNSEAATGGEPAEEESQAQESKTTYEPGAALLEIFKADSMDNLPPLPLIRTYWNRDLAFSGSFPIPERISEIGEGPYVACFSFYYEAKTAGKYGFSVQRTSRTSAGRTMSGGGRDRSTLKLSIGSVEIAKLDETQQVCQGIANLESGFHRIELRLADRISYSMVMRDSRSYINYGRTPTRSFEVKLLTPGAFDTVPLTKDMMLLKKQPPSEDAKKLQG